MLKVRSIERNLVNIKFKANKAYILNVRVTERNLLNTKRKGNFNVRKVGLLKVLPPLPTINRSWQTALLDRVRPKISS